MPCGHASDQAATPGHDLLMCISLPSQLHINTLNNVALRIMPGMRSIGTSVYRLFHECIKIKNQRTTEG